MRAFVLGRGGGPEEEARFVIQEEAFSSPQFPPRLGWAGAGLGWESWVPCPSPALEQMAL